MQPVAKEILKKLFNAHAEVLKALRILRKEDEIPFDNKTWNACLDMVDNIKDKVHDVDIFLKSTD